MKRLFLLFLFSSIGVLTTFAQHTKKNGTKLKTPVVQSIPAPSVSTGKSGAAQKKARRTKTETPAPAVKGQRQTSAKGQPQPLVKGRQPQVKGHQPPQGKMQQNVRGKASARNARTGRKGAKAPAYVTTEEIKGLQKQNQQLQKEISEHEEEVKIKQKDVDSRLQKIVRLDTEIGQHQRTIDNIATDIKGLDTNIGILKGQLSSLEAQLGERRARFIRSMRYMARHRSIQDKLMFVFSAKSLTQMYRRLRFVREYAAYQRAQGEQLKAKQQQVDQKHTQLKQVRGNKSNLLYKDRQVHAQMERKRVEQQTVVASLQNDQKVLQGVIAQRRQQQQALNAQIDRLIQIEIQKARADQAAREAEATRVAAERKAAADRERAAREAAAARASASESNDMLSSADRAITGSFANNRGRLPMPLSGRIVSHFGQYNVAGMSNIRLNNDGINIKGAPGSAVRSVFMGEVSGVFMAGGMSVVMVRHGIYISVYANLGSVSVGKGQKVGTGQTIGTVGRSGILQFQLRKETAKLNPEQWLR